MRFLVIILFLSLGCDNNPSSPGIVTCDEGYSMIEGYTDYLNDLCYNDNDIAVLEDFISNSLSTISLDMDINNNQIIEWFELGSQEWSNGRIISFWSYYNRLTDLYTNPYADIVYTANLSGDIPESIINWDKIELLQLGRGRFNGLLTGSIEVLTNLTSLEHLCIQNNDFDSQPIPENIYNLTNIKTIYFGMNSFTGNISSNISNLADLEWFWVGDNDLSGIFPEEIWFIPNIKEITVYNNNFSGIIPNLSTNQLSELYWLQLYNNNFTSTIPNSICNSTELMNNLGEYSLDDYNWSGEYYYYFDISNNSFCPNPETLEYPTCINNYMGQQNTENCDGEIFNSFNSNSFQKINNNRNTSTILNKPPK